MEERDLSNFCTERERVIYGNFNEESLRAYFRTYTSILGTASIRLIVAPEHELRQWHEAARNREEAHYAKIYPPGFQEKLERYSGSQQLN